jgi:biotin carboxylase
MPPNKVLVLGDYRQTVTVVRSLGRAGFRVILGHEQAHSSTALSRYVACERRLDASSPERYCESVETALREERPEIVFPVGESELRRLLRSGHHALPSLAIWVMPEAPTVLRCFDKRAMYHLVTALGIPAPAWRPYSGILGALRDAQDLGYPVVVKRKDSSAMLRGTNAVICRSAAELEKFIMDAQSDPDVGSLLLQKCASGYRHNCHFAASRGRIVAFFQQQVLRTDGRDGTGIGIEGVSVAPLPELRACCEKLLDHLQYTGIGCIQFLVDETSREIAFLELNARMDSTAALPYALGMDFPRMAVQIAIGERVDAPEHYRIGKRYYYLYGAFNLWLAHRRDVPLGSFVAWPFTVPWVACTTCDLVLDWRDPLPALHQFGKRAIGSTLKAVQKPEAKRPEASIESGART